MTGEHFGHIDYDQEILFVTYFLGHHRFAPFWCGDIFKDASDGDDSKRYGLCGYYGPEFTSKALDKWAYDKNIALDLSRPGKPTDNGFIESFTGRLRDECLIAN